MEDRNHDEDRPSDSISRRDAVKALGGLSLTGLLGGYAPDGSASSGSSQERPNVLFVMADQFRRQAMGFMDDPVRTPNFDAFAEEGQAFTNAISSVPICTPTRAMLMTGRYPMSTGMTSNCMPGLEQQLSRDETTLSDVWSANGYRTGFMGKWHLDRPAENDSTQPPGGADGWDAWTPPGPLRHGFDFWYAYNAGHQHFHQHYWKDSPEKIKPNEWSPRHETDVAIDFIRDRPDDRPFALCMFMNPPHPPFIAPDKYEAMYEGKDFSSLRPNVMGEGGKRGRKQASSYFAAVTSVDAQFGRLLQTLEEEGIADNTIVVFTSDHGEMMGSHGEMKKGYWHEESVGVPFLIRWPGRIEPGMQDLVFGSVDIMPTMLGLMDLPIPGQVEGRDRSDVLLGQAPPPEDASSFIASYPGPGPEHKRAVGQEPHPWVTYHFDMAEQGFDWKKWGYRALRTKRYSYVVDRVPVGIDGFSFDGYSERPYQGPTEIRTTRLLYDLQEDPYQMNPIRAEKADEHPVMQRLNKRLQRKLDTMNDPFPV
jgi:arylsulfatase A-like enzyme